MLPEVLSFGKAAAQGSFCSFCGLLCLRPPVGTRLLHHHNAPGHEVLWQGQLFPWGHCLRVGRRGQSKSWGCGARYFKLWWVVLSLVPPNGRSKQPGMCALCGFPGMLWIAWGRAQEYKMQTSGTGIYRAALGTPLATQNMEANQDH